MPTQSPKASPTGADVDAMFAAFGRQPPAKGGEPTDQRAKSVPLVRWARCDNCGAEQVAMATFRGSHDYADQLDNAAAVHELVARVRKARDIRSVGLCDLCIATAQLPPIAEQLTFGRQ